MRSRACWIYGMYGKFPINEDHLRNVLDCLYANLQHNDLPVRVNASIALINLLDHEVAIEFLRPGLETIISIYLKLMDDIDYDELVNALNTLVGVFYEDIGPHALKLCDKLSQAFIRLLNSTSPDD